MDASQTIIIAAVGTTSPLPKPGRLHGIIPVAGATPTLQCFDNGSAASGDEIFPASTLVAGTPVMFPGGIPLKRGLTCVASGAGFKAVLLVS